VVPEKIGAAPPYATCSAVNSCAQEIPISWKPLAAIKLERRQAPQVESVQLARANSFHNEMKTPVLASEIDSERGLTSK
jgi:hypothetical protein